MRASYLLPVIAGVLLLAPGLSPPVWAQKPPAAPTSAPTTDPPPAPTAPKWPVSKHGSFEPGVYVDDITYTIRVAYPKGITVSRHNPNVAYVGSFDGYVWKTDDGGLTWDESRLIVEPRPYYGDGGQRLYFGKHRVAGGPISAADSASVKYGRKLAASGYSAGTSDSDSGGGGAKRGAGANVNFGIGVPGGAPRLQLLVRKFGKPTSGLNMKQTLLYVGTRPTEVRIIVEHPTNPKIVYACTAFGLFVTLDGGLNWVRTFMGTTPKGRFVFHVAVDPNDEKKVFLASGEGVYISRDGGENFLKTTAKGVGEGIIDWIYINPYNSKHIFVGTDYGLLRSKDGGRDWEWIYFTTFPDGRVVRAIVIDPFDKKTGYIATHDGLFMIPDLNNGGLDDWRRMGGLSLTGMETSRLVACPKHKGHMWTLTNMKLQKPDVAGKHDTGGAFIYESIDGGKNWRVIFSGHTTGSMQWFDNDPSDPDLLWIAWSRGLHRMKRKKMEARKKPNIPDDPPIGEVLAAAMAYTGVEPERQLKYRGMSRLKALMPSIDMDFIYHRWNDYSLMHDAAYPLLPFKLDERHKAYYRDFRVMFNWDLTSLVFDLQASFFGRLSRINGEVWGQMISSVHRLYGERRRLRVIMANSPPKDLRVRVIYKLRIKELTSYIDFITGGYLEHWRQGHRDPGIATKWWVPWPNTAHARPR